MLSVVFRKPINEHCLQTKRPPGNLGGLFFQGRIVPTELLTHQNFLPESYEPENRSVKQNFLIKYYYFQ